MSNLRFKNASFWVNQANLKDAEEILESKPINLAKLPEGELNTNDNEHYSCDTIEVRHGTPSNSIHCHNECLIRVPDKKAEEVKTEFRNSGIYLKSLYYNSNGDLICE